MLGTRTILLCRRRSRDKHPDSSPKLMTKQTTKMLRLKLYCCLDAPIKYCDNVTKLGPNPLATYYTITFAAGMAALLVSGRLTFKIHCLTLTHVMLHCAMNSNKNIRPIQFKIQESQKRKNADAY